MRLSLTLITSGVLAFAASCVWAQQDYPNKPLRILAPPAAGGGGDFIARQIGQGISGPLGQPVVIDNRTGVVVAETLSKAPPDGYLMSVSSGLIWTGPLLRKLPWDVQRDFAPVTLAVREVNVLAVHPSLPVKNVKELIALAKAKPGELNYGSGAIGSIDHLSMELLKYMAGINIVRVGYKGDAQGLTGLMSGEVQVYVKDAGLIAPHVKTGKLRALATTNAEPSALAPGLPTVAASGLPGYEAVSMSGVFVPSKTPEAIIARLNREIVRVLVQPDVKERFFKSGVEVAATSPEEFAKIIRSDMERMGKVIKEAGIVDE